MPEAREALEITGLDVATPASPLSEALEVLGRGDRVPGKAGPGAALRLAARAPQVRMT